MEMRKLQRTGGSSLAMTLPKKWVDYFQLKDKDSVCVYFQKSGFIIIQPARFKDQIFKSVLHINGFTENMVTRELIASYISGFDEVTIESKKITQDQRDSIRKISQSLLGYEIVDESSQKILIRNILDMAKFPVVDTINKMLVITKSMLEDAIKAVMQNNQVLARDVIDRDFEIDKIQMAITRQFHALIQGRVFDEQIALSQADLKYYETVATQLERVADHAVKIASTVMMVDKKLKIGISRRLMDGAKKTILLLEDSKEMVKKTNKNLAHRILDRETAMEKVLPIRGRATLFQEVIIIDSLYLVHKRIMNLAEATIDRAVAKQGQ